MYHKIDVYVNNSLIETDDPTLQILMTFPFSPALVRSNRVKKPRPDV